MNLIYVAVMLNITVCLIINEDNNLFTEPITSSD